MMKHISRILCVVIAGLLLCCLSACAKTTDGTDTDNAQTTVATPTTAPVPTVTVIDVPDVDVSTVVSAEEYFGKFQAKNMGGREISITPGWALSLDSKGDPPDPTRDGFKNEQLRIWDNMIRVCEKYNCEIVQGWDWDYYYWPEALIEAYLANEPTSDAIAMITFQPIHTASAGILHKIADIAPPYSDLFNDQKLITPSPDEFVGKYGWYWTPLNRDYGPSGIGYNRDILASLGLEDPKALFNRGEWTLEKFYEYALAAVRINSAGVVEQWGTCMGYLNIGRMALVAYEHWEYFKDPADGKYKTALADPKFLKCLEVNTRIFLEDKSGISIEGNYYGSAGDEYIQGNVLFWDCGVNGVPKDENALTFDYGLVPYPLIPENKSGIHYYPQNIVISIPIGVEDPQGVFLIMEEVMSYNYNHEEEAYDDLMDQYAANFTHDDDIQMDMDINLYMCSPRIILRHEYPWEGIVSQVSQGNMTPAQAIEERIQECQDMVDEFLHTDMGFIQ